MAKKNKNKNQARKQRRARYRKEARKQREEAMSTKPKIIITDAEFMKNYDKELQAAIDDVMKGGVEQIRIYMNDILFATVRASDDPDYPVEVAEYLVRVDLT